MIRVALPALALAAAFAVCAPAFAADGTDEVVATAPPTNGSVSTAAATPAAVPAPMSTADQIDLYLKTSPAAVLPKDSGGVTSSAVEEKRQVHGEVDVAVGNHGYRSGYVRSDFPVGKTGTLSIAVEDSQYNGRVGRYGGYGGGYGGYGGGLFGGGPSSRQSVAIGLNFAGSSTNDRCRAQDWNGMRSHRIDPAYTGDSSYIDRHCPTPAQEDARAADRGPPLD